jgi:hypothetical protein
VREDQSGAIHAVAEEIATLEFDPIPIKILQFDDFTASRG